MLLAYNVLVSLGEPPGSAAQYIKQQAVALEKTLDSTSGASQGAADVQVTQRLGRFVLLRQLGAGGMGNVFAAYDEQLDRKVALKLLHQSAMADGNQRLRVVREAQAMARISHPNVVHVYDIGEVGGRIFIAMEFIDGSTLTAWQEAAPRSWQDTLQLYRQAGEGLYAAHQTGLVHRDFKPDNVLIDREERVHVADFGLARLHGEAQPSVASSTGGDAAVSTGPTPTTPQTIAGSICGTPGFMSPEQYRGESADHRSDQFSFCVALYQALFGRLPFAGESLAELSENVLAGRLLPIPENSPVPMAIREALLRGLSIDPAQRFSTMGELLEMFAGDSERETATARLARRRLTYTLGGGGILLVAIALGFVGTAGLTLPTLAGLAGFMFFITVVGALVLRRTLLKNSLHRGIVGLLLVAHGTWFVVRCLAMVLHLPVEQFITLDLTITAGLYATVAYQYLPGLWWWVPCAVAGSVFSVLRPQYAQQSLLVVYTLIAFVAVFAWERAANQRQQRKRTGGQSASQPSKSGG